MSSSSYIASVPKLRGRENYDDWAFAAENFLILDGLEKCISDPNAETDTSKIAQARSKLILTIDTSLYVHIRETKTAADLWTKLKSMFADTGFMRRITLLRTLISTRLDGCDNMASYVNQIIESSQRLRATGFKIDEEWIGSLLLAGLPEKYSPMIMAIEHSGISITADSIKTKLLDMEIDADKTGTAFVGRNSNTRNKKNGSNIGRNSYNAGNHAGIDKLKAGNHAGSDALNVKKDITSITCYGCKQKGHFKSKCPNKYNERGANVFSAVFLSGQFNAQDFYVDSGASMHLTPNKSWLKNAKQSEVCEIVVANKSRVSVDCLGDLDITTVVKDLTFDATIKDVLCVPQLTTNLLSVSQLIKNGNEVVFEATGCKIYNPQRQLVGVAILENNVYKLQAKVNTECLSSGLLATSCETWHRRLGHLNSKDMIKMRNGVVDGMQCIDEIRIGRENCETCNEGKQVRLSFPRKGSRANSMLELIHADICGPMEVRSVGGAKYFLILEDDFSRMAFVYFLKTKDETFRRFREFKNMAENQLDKKIKTLRTDNGGEFCSTDFENYLKKYGIIHQKTSPYTPEQNGSSERMNRTVVERARCLLFDAKLEKRFWAEAVNTAVYLRNRSTTSGVVDKTPFEIWTGRKPDISHLRIFGSPAMVQIPKEKRLKWDKKSKRMLLVGYSDTTKGYRLYNPDINDVIISRNVIIMEKVNEEVKVIIGDSQAEGKNLHDSKEDKKVPDSVGDLNEDDNDSYDSVESTVPESEASDDVFSINDNTLANQNTGDVRKSSRIPKPKDFKDYVTYLCEGEIDEVPNTVEEAFSRSDAEKWKSAVQEELQSFEENDAWVFEDLPEDATLVKCKWVFKKKINCDGEVKYRARLVAKGFTQRPGIDYDETFSPVVRYSTLRLLIALSAQLNLDIQHLDVKTAFLNGHLKERVYMEIPEGMICKGNKVLRLKREMKYV